METQTDFITETSDNNFYNTENIAFVFFDLETGGFKVGKDILQIAMKTENLCFSTYITPRKSIDTSASAVTGLTRNGRQLYLHGSPVPSIISKNAFSETIKFLNSLKKKVILIAHNCQFDYKHFVHAAEQHGLVDELDEIIVGFSDTLPLFKLKLPNRPNKYSLPVLAKDLLEISTDAAHNAIFDINVLEKLAILYLDKNDFIKTKITIKEIIETNERDKKSKEIEKTLVPLKDVLSKAMIQRLAVNNITYDKILKKYKEEGEKECILLLKGEVNGKPQIIKTKNILDKIIEFIRRSNE